MGDAKDLEKHVSSKQLSDAKAEREEIPETQTMNIGEWKRAHDEAEIRFVCSGMAARSLTWRRYKTILLTARNQKVANHLKKRYAVHFKPGCLPVFCEDNRTYHTCRNMQEAILSGIPELRKFCYSIPAKAQFRAGSHYIGTQLPSLVSSLGLWIAAARDPEVKALTEIMPVKTLYNVCLH